jgi:uncharacterized protein
MELSRHNIFSRVRHSDHFFLVNLLSGNADILSHAEGQRYLRSEILNDPEFIAKGYVVDLEEEERNFKMQYLNFIDLRDTDEIQLFYAPTYTCNFSCQYCYQSGYEHQPSHDPLLVADAFFSYIRKAFHDRRKYITLFGGEPLLWNASARACVDLFLDHCKEMNLELAVVTNGYHLEEYLPSLVRAAIREIQVTLDGPEKVHNLRRHLNDSSGTFSKIVRGIDAALAMGIPVNLRVVLDGDNFRSLPLLARFAIEKGWTQSPLFKTQIGRNYELHFCQSPRSRLYSRLQLYNDLYLLIQKNPYLLEFHKPAFSVSRFLFENGVLPGPLFDSCPGCKTEWGFDYTGSIYACTATLGKEGEKLGNFYPHVSLEMEKIEKWQQRDVLSIQACQSCNLRLACGGGCAAVAFHQYKDLNTHDCRPVKELMELGFSVYNDEP